MSEKNIIDINEIQKYIPHRYPFLLVDKIISFIPNKSAVGIKNVTMNEYFFQGHFPDEPIMPGVLQIEALAQTACVLVSKSLRDADTAPKDMGILFTTIEKVKFKKPVVPGDVLELHVKIIKNKLSIYVIDAYITVDDEKVTEAEFSALLYDKDKRKK